MHKLNQANNPSHVPITLIESPNEVHLYYNYTKLPFFIFTSTHNIIL